MNVDYKKHLLASFNCLICSCLLNNKILKDGEIKNVALSKTHRFKIKLILNSLLKVETRFSDGKMANLIGSKSVLESIGLSLKEDVKNLICMMVNKTIEKSSTV